MSNFPSPRGTAVPTHVRPCASHWARCGNSPRSLTIPNYRYFRCGDPTILNCQFVARRAAFASRSGWSRARGARKRCPLARGDRRKLAGVSVESRGDDREFGSKIAARRARGRRPRTAGSIARAIGGRQNPTCSRCSRQRDDPGAPSGLG